MNLFGITEDKTITLNTIFEKNLNAETKVLNLDKPLSSFSLELYMVVLKNIF